MEGRRVGAESLAQGKETQQLAVCARGLLFFVQDREGQRSIDEMVMANSGWWAEFFLDSPAPCAFYVSAHVCVRDPRTPFPSVCLHVWFVVPPVCPEGPREPLSPARRQAAEPGRGHAGSCRVSELRVGFELKVLEVEINPSLSPCLSPPPRLLRKPLSPPAAPSRSGCQLPPDLSCAQVKREGEEGGGA